MVINHLLNGMILQVVMNMYRRIGVSHNHRPGQMATQLFKIHRGS